ncbi:MAG: extracellular solute-binding protein [Clostridiaceae bacterium]|nr:extracellular solute-binding protein [Clostridiaceae bacterium]
MKRKVIAILLIAVLFLLGLGGCQSGTSKSTDPPAGKTDPPAGKTDPPAGKTRLDPAQFKGVTVKVTSYQQDSPHNEAVLAELNKRLGITTEWYICPASEGWAATDRLLAANPDIDIMYNGRGRMEDYVSKGYLYDLTSHLDRTEEFPNLAKQSFDLARMYPTADGKHYSLPRLGPGGYGGTMGYTLAVREDWLAQCNLDMPETIADLDEILVAFKAMDPSKYPLFTVSSKGMLGAMGLVLSGAFTDCATGWWDDNGTLRHPIQDPGWKNFVAKVREWYEKGYLHPEFITANTQATTQLMSAGEIGVLTSWCTTAINPNKALMEENPKHRFEYTKGTLSGDKPAKLVGNSFASEFTNINANTKNIDAVLYFLDRMGDRDIRMLTHYGIEGLNYRIENRKLIRETGDKAYVGQYSTYGAETEMVVTFEHENELFDPGPLGNHYIDSQKPNWFRIFYSDERMKQIIYEPDTGLIYDYTTGDNEYYELSTVASTYITEMLTDMVTGKLGMDQWDAKIAELENIALNQMTKERNEQWEKYGKKVYKSDGKQVIYEKDMLPWMKEHVW